MQTFFRTDIPLQQVYISVLVCCLGGCMPVHAVLPLQMGSLQKVPPLI